MAKGQPNDPSMKLNFIPRVWDEIAGEWKQLYIAPDATDKNRGDVYLSDALDGTDDAETGVTAATPLAVKKVQDYADTKVSKVDTEPQTISSDLNPKQNNSLSLGTSTLKWKDIYASNFHGDLDGNAATATTANLAYTANRLTTARNLAGQPFDGSADIHWYGTCTTVSNVADKVCTISQFTLNTGAMVFIKFAFTNTAENPTLNINNTKAIPIMRYGNITPGTSSTLSWETGSVVGFVYDGTYWQMIGWLNDNTTYGPVTTENNGLMIASDKLKLDYTNVAYCTCATGASTATKVITLSGNTSWKLQTGSIIVVKFNYTNTASTPYFNVNSTGAKRVWYNTEQIGTTNLEYAGIANRPSIYMYDGTQYVFIGWSYDQDTWTVLKGATSTTAGVAGYVPTPAAGSQEKFLRGDGTWATVSTEDIKVTQTATSTSAAYPILFKNTTSTTTVTDTARFGSGITVNPSTKTITATTFSGSLNGNATSATTATTATSASKLTNSRNLAGRPFDGSSDIVWYGTSSTGAATAAKTCSVTGFTLVTGAMVFVKFSYTNTAANPTLNVNSTGDKTIYRYSTTAPGTTAHASWYANSVVCFIYDGTYWRMIGSYNDDIDSVYVGSTQPTDNRVKLWIEP